MMSSSMTPPIEQQMYTRERRGVFRTTEGFDTVAASPGLDPSFIKKYFILIASMTLQRN